MSKFPTQKEYLFSTGILESGDKQTIAEYKRYYRKEYLKWKKEAFLKQNRIVSVSFPLKEGYRLESKAHSYNMTLPEFIRATIKAYEKQTFLLPKKSEVRELRMQIRKIGNNINQVAKAYNGASMSQAKAVATMKQYLKQMDTVITKTLQEPKSFENFIRKSIQEHPRLKSKLKYLVQELCL